MCICDVHTAKCNFLLLSCLQEPLQEQTEVYQRIASPLLTVGCKKREENKGKKKGNDEVMSDVRMNMLKDYESTLNADNW